MSKDISKIAVEIESEEQFQSLIDETDSKLLLVDCYVDWCGPCEAIRPTLQKVWMEYEAPAERITFATMDMKKFSKVINDLFPEDKFPDVENNGSLPLFLIIRLKGLVAHISGIDAPFLLTNISTYIPERDD